MNTFCSIQAEGEDNVFIEDAIEEIFLRLKRIEERFNRYSNDSEISRLNRDASDFPVELNSETFRLIVRAIELSKLTHGAFDISTGAAVDFWRSCEKENVLPVKERIRELKENIGYQNIIPDFERQAIRFVKPGIKIDLGALAKGYALDEAVNILREKEITQAQVNLGGNIYVLDNQPQDIGIRNPVAQDEIITIVNLMNNSISTSANYERSFTIRNKRIGHIIDPLTGYPAESEILSVSVIAQDAALADALSTAIFVLGFKKGRELLTGIKDVEAIIVTESLFAKRPKIYNVKGGN